MDNRELHNEIAKLAYELFEENGYGHGNDLGHWFEAERLVISRYSATVEEKPKRRRAVGKPPEKKKAMAKKGGKSASRPATGKRKAKKA